MLQLSRDGPTKKEPKPGEAYFKLKNELNKIIHEKRRETIAQRLEEQKQQEEENDEDDDEEFEEFSDCESSKNGEKATKTIIFNSDEEEIDEEINNEKEDEVEAKNEENDEEEEENEMESNKDSDENESSCDDPEQEEKPKRSRIISAFMDDSDDEGVSKETSISVLPNH